MRANKKTVEALDSALARAKRGKIQTVVVVWSEEVLGGKELQQLTDKIADIVTAPDSLLSDTTIEDSEKNHGVGREL